MQVELWVTTVAQTNGGIIVDITECIGNHPIVLVKRSFRV